MKELKYYSYDIFDTCLVRACGRPEFVFDILASRILGNTTDITQRMDFSEIRRKAESQAIIKHRTNEIEDVTIDEIYNECDFSSLTDISNSIIKNTELEIEHELLVPVETIKEQITEQRSHGAKILFLSDMYLPSDFIRDILKEKGFFCDKDEIYVSSQYRKKKSTGSLFKLVKTIENIDLQGWMHYGDNLQSDIKIPRDLGIKAQRIIHPWSFYERALSIQETTSYHFNLKIMASISRAIRLSNNKSPELYYASDFIAPLYVPFVYSIMADAEKKGIKGLFFLARDGFIFYKIALCFKKKFPNINLHYLYVSRKSLYLPGLTDFSYDSIRNSFFSWDQCTLSDVLDKFQLDGYNPHSRYHSITGEELLKCLSKDTDFIIALNNKWQEQRKFCIEYFKAEGLADGNTAIVDLSGSRKCQLSINTIIESQNYPPVSGYYFDVLYEHIIDNNYHSAFFSSRYGYNYLNIRKEPQVVFEQYFSAAPHSRTISYFNNNGHIEPVFEKERSDLHNAVSISETNCMVCEKYAELFLSTINVENVDSLIRHALHLYTIFYFIPEPYYLKAIENVCESNLTTIRPLLKKQSMLMYVIKRKREWFYGNFIYNTFFKKIAFRLLIVLYLLKRWKRSKELL